MRNKKILIIAIILLFTVVGFIGRWNSEKVEARIKTNMDAIANYETDVLVSSNPYDYINNEYYRAIVDMGMDAVEPLTNNYLNNSTSLNGYIAALAIIDITDTKVSEIMGEDWETAQEFQKLWNELLQTMPSDFERILTTSNEPEKEIEKYGIFGEAFANKIREDSETVDFAGQCIEYESLQVNEDQLQHFIHEENSELRKAEEYVVKMQGVTRK